MQAENNSKRLALVIGNSFYSEAFPVLRNSKKDAENVKAKLESLGFAIDNDPIVDRTHRDMLQDALSFIKRIRNDVTDIVFYYAGHGCSIQGKNFLIPIDGHSPEEPTIAKQAYISLDWLIDLIAKNRPPDVPIIIIVDCCRTEVANEQSVHGDFINSAAALSNICIMYATTNGHAAKDGGEGRNGTFTERLLEYLDANMTIMEISNRIAKELKGGQTPWITSSMSDHYRFRQLTKQHTKAFAKAEMVAVPFRKNNCFIGRADILNEMEEKLCRNQLSGDCVPLVLSGLGGMGKTQLMLQYYYTHRSEYKDVFWLNAEGTVAVMDVFRLLAETLRIKVDENEKGDRDGMLADRIRECLEARSERWLLMLDNVDNLRDVSRFIPSMGGDVIVTTREHIDRRWGSVIRVNKMTKSDALLLLVGPENQCTPSESAVKIVDELDCMPLAIDIVRAYIDRTGTSLESYLKMYKAKNAILLKNMKDMNLDQYNNTIATLWDLSFEKIHDQNKLAELILGICAILQPDTIPVSLFEHQSTTLLLGASAEAIHDAIGVLVQFSFVQRAVHRDENEVINDHHDQGKDIIIIHRLVQAVIRNIRMEHDDLWRMCERLVAAFSKEMIPGDCYNPQVRKMYTLYVPHIRQVVHEVDWRQMDVKSRSLLRDLLFQTVWHFINFDDGFQGLQDLANIALLISEETDGLEHLNTANSLTNLAALYNNQGKYDEAEPLLQRGILIIEKTLGLDHPGMAISMDNLAILYFNQGMYDKAEPLYQRALAIKEKVLGSDHLSVADSLNDLANVYDKKRQYNEAESLHQRALVIREKALGPNHHETAQSLNNLASVYSKQDKYDKAERLFQQALEIRKKYFGTQPSAHGKIAI